MGNLAAATTDDHVLTIEDLRRMWMPSTAFETVEDFTKMRNKLAAPKLACDSVFISMEEDKKTTIKGFIVEENNECVLILYRKKPKKKKKDEEEPEPVIELTDDELPEILLDDWFAKRESAVIVIPKQRVTNIKTCAEKMKAFHRDTARSIIDPEFYILHRAYTVEEIITAMRPYIRKFANKFATHRCPFEECEINGELGVWHAIRTDACLAPFATHAHHHIQTNVRRPSMTSGVIRRSERAGDLLGTPVSINQTIGHGSMDGDMQLAEILTGKPSPLADGDRFMNPLESLMERDQKEVTAMKLGKIIQEAVRRENLTEQEYNVVANLYGLFGREQMSGADLADEIGVSRQRVGQCRKSALKKIKNVIDNYGRF